MEVKARPAGAAAGGVGSRAITGGHTTTISPDLVCMRTTRSAIPGLLARASHPDRWSASCAWEMGRWVGVSSHDARIARSNVVPCIERVLCPLCLVCLRYHGQCVAYGGAAAPATPAATLRTHALVPLHPLEHAGCVRQSSLRMRAFRWHVCASDFVRPADRVIKHKVFCVCAFGPYFLYAFVYFVAGATCWSGQTSTILSLL